MEVKLQSEVRAPVKPAVVVGFILLLCVAIGLILLTMGYWYFPKRTSWWLAVPASVAGVYLAILIARTPSRSRHGRIRGILGNVSVVLFLPFIMSMGFAVAAPSLLLRLQGPQTTVTDTVAFHQRGSRSCQYKIGLSRHYSRLNARLCVSRAQYDQLARGRKVLLTVREGYFGVLAFSVQPAEAGPE